jgi:hypothetical protein
MSREPLKPTIFKHNVDYTFGILRLLTSHPQPQCTVLEAFTIRAHEQRALGISSNPDKHAVLWEE